MRTIDETSSYSTFYKRRGPDSTRIRNEHDSKSPSVESCRFPKKKNEEPFYTNDPSTLQHCQLLLTVVDGSRQLSTNTTQLRDTTRSQEIVRNDHNSIVIASSGKKSQYRDRSNNTSDRRAQARTLGVFIAFKKRFTIYWR